MKIDYIDFSIHYAIGKCDIEIPDDVVKELEDAYKNNKEITRREYPSAWNWLTLNINDGDASTWIPKVNEIICMKLI